MVQGGADRDAADAVARARGSFEHQVWGEACAGFLEHAESLDADDLERLAVCAYLVAKDQDSDAAWARAYQQRSAAGDVEGAGRCAFWIGFRLVNAHERSEANGWIARLARLAERSPADSLVRGRLAYLTGLRTVFEGGRLDSSAEDLDRAAQFGARKLDEELVAIAHLALGRVRIFQREITEGVRLLDDAMLTVRSEPMSPIAVGDSYCTAIDACHDLMDVRRGQEWTDALTQWCEGQPDMVPFAGICQVHRAEFLQLTGSWPEAAAQATLARARLSTPSLQQSYGDAVYRQAELSRLRGDAAQAESQYREASRAGRDPQPGLALLRLGQGRQEEAARAIDRALAETDGPGRPDILAAGVDVMLACGRPDDARAVAARLESAARALTSPLLDALSQRAAGSVLLTEGDPGAALVQLRKAGEGFRRLGSPYEAARTAALIGRACQAFGDEEGARLEFGAARSVFERLGARPDLVALLRGRTPERLTARELQVLRLVAGGDTNRIIGEKLGLSERTVDRHVSNIFAKLGVSSRSAATARAYESQLL